MENHLNSKNVALTRPTSLKEQSSFFFFFFASVAQAFPKSLLICFDMSIVELHLSREFTGIVKPYEGKYTM